MEIRVFIADDHPLFRQGVCALLEKEEGIEVVGEAATGIETLDRAKDLDIDVLLLDINMPGLSGPEVVRQLLPNKPKLKIVILTMHDDAYYVQELFNMGVKGYVLKKSAGTDLVRAISAVSNGNSYIDPALVDVVMAPYTRGGKHEKSDRLSLLSPREQEVCRLLALGYSHAKIGQMLNISSRTVESHRSHIISKLDLTGRAGLIQFALEYGLLKPV